MATTHDKSYQTGIYVKQGGQELHVGNPVPGPDGTGSAVVVGAGSTPVALAATFTPAAGAATVTNVTIQFQDGLGNALTVPVNFDLYLSDAATGAGLTAVTASGAVGAGASGVDVGTYTAKKALRCQTTAAGVYVLSITDTAKTGFFVCVTGGWGQSIVSAQLITANYG